MQEIVITAFADADREGVLNVILPIQQQEFGIPITEADQPDLTSIPEFYQSGTGGFWVARSDGEVVGTVGLKDIGSGQTALRKMFVAAAFRGPGAGSGIKASRRTASACPRAGCSEGFSRHHGQISGGASFL